MSEPAVETDSSQATKRSASPIENNNLVDKKPKLEEVASETKGEMEPPIKQEQLIETKVEKSDDNNNNSNSNDNSSNNNTNNAGANDNIMVVPSTKPQLFYTTLKTGIAYDVRMRYHAKIFTSYFEYIDPHPEDPRRIYRIYKILAEAGLIQDSALSGTDDIGPLMVKIPVREATSEEILQVHTEEHLKFIESTENMTREKLLEETEKGDSIYVNNDSFLSAKLSCGGTIEACRAVVEGRVKNSLAIVRPPGHHAEPHAPGGFCLFSNVAVAAKNILKNYPESVRKIVIVDWDIHHGNGTQKSFYDDPRVLYISLHRYDNGKYYPGTKYGNSDQVGEGLGEGTSVNIPWSTGGMHDGDYYYAFNKVVIPIVSEFDPDLVIVSAGFDAADGDIIGGCHVSPAGYGQMTHMLKAIERGKMCVVLEGGYNLDSISKSALAVAKVMVGEPPEKTITLQPHLETLEVIDEVIKIQSKYWKCMKPGFTKNSFDDFYDLQVNNEDADSNGSSEKKVAPFKLSNLSDPIRSSQANDLFTRYSFINLPIVSSIVSGEGDKSSLFTTDLPPSTEDLVLASPDIHNATTIVISIHDPAEIWANINPTNGVIEGNSSLVLEHPLIQVIEKIKKEVDLEAGKQLGFIDINIPPFLLPVSSSLKAGTPTGTAQSNGSTTNSSSSSSSNSNYNPTVFSQELMLYIWDNYISYFSQLEKLVFVGFGDAYQSIVHLYAKRPSQDIKELVKGTVAFVNRSALKPLVPVMDESMVDWYYQNSVIFTSALNPCWTNGGDSVNVSNGNGMILNGRDNAHGVDDSSKRPRRKFGRVIRASADGFWDVVSERFEEGMDFILDSVEDYSSEGSS
ncbi:histone deacetylase Hda1p [[Candida] railenensis]|uniref:Histone deacetylase HDA1 n=1 Tax=[Candida] railenensis TaxID=45579 RepID=A0A9P0QTY9_9ASCO|nr:histone deacetylase Hda1p [[Candida] railenensis]